MSARDAAIGALPIALLIGVWALIAGMGWAPPALLPAPGAVFLRLGQQLLSADFLGHGATTLFRHSIETPCPLCKGHSTLALAPLGRAAFGGTVCGSPISFFRSSDSDVNCDITLSHRPCDVGLFGLCRGKPN